MNILRHGPDVEVLTPTQVREQGRMRAEKTVGRYGTKQGAISVSMLFIKYISDKYGNSSDFTAPVTIPRGASFKDMVALKGKRESTNELGYQATHCHAQSRCGIDSRTPEDGRSDGQGVIE